MIGSEELEFLLGEEARRLIEENINRNPIDIALAKGVSNAGVIATQVKRLQRARKKLPSYYACRAILPPRAYEQSSSEECALRKPLSGESVLDLTCGLGVDTLALSRHFKSVVTIERDEIVASVAKENFKRLGVDNIEVICTSAEEYLAKCDRHFDWCFVDPDRRGESGEKMVRLEDCSPNIVALMPQIREKAECVCVKCSPLFDVEEAFRLFGECRVECVSLAGEAKEVNIYIDGGAARLAAVAVGVGEVEFPYEERKAAFSPMPESLDEYRYVVLPDVALQHTRLVAQALRGECDVWSNGGVALSREMPKGVLGRIFAVESICELDGAFKKMMRGRKVEIYRRDFPMSNGDICKRYRCSEGGSERWCFTRIGDRFLAIKMNTI
ncbi:MAG: RsmD family RNA methyltransferase [Alistipes sp.]|nr:RsmD family RNA methyltransferase [Alistipes sp.]